MNNIVCCSYISNMKEGMSGYDKQVPEQLAVRSAWKWPPDGEL
jgi:hypothetical protein